MNVCDTWQPLQWNVCLSLCLHSCLFIYFLIIASHHGRLTNHLSFFYWACFLFTAFVSHFSHKLMHWCFLHYICICFCTFVCVCVGGEGKVGKVVDIRGWDNESGRSVASVTWSNGTTNVYRMGHKGKVDLKYVTDGQGGFYYKDHLPKLGKTDFLYSSMHSLESLKLFSGSETWFNLM